MFRSLSLQAVALIAACNIATAQEAAKPKPTPINKTAKLKREIGKATEKGADALPCPREERPADGFQVKPTANPNSRPTGVGPYRLAWFISRMVTP